MLAGDGATPTSASRSLRSCTRGTPSAMSEAREARWNGASSASSGMRTRMRSLAACRNGSTSPRDQPGIRPRRARRSRARCPRSRHSRCGSAAADHRGARELDAPAAIAVVGGVAALVRLGQPGGVEHVGRPTPVGVAAEVGTGLEHEDGLVRALGEQAGERGARRASPDDQRVDAVRQRSTPQGYALRPEHSRECTSLGRARF